MNNRDRNGGYRPAQPPTYTSNQRPTVYNSQNSGMPGRGTQTRPTGQRASQTQRPQTSQRTGQRAHQNGASERRPAVRGGYYPPKNMKPQGNWIPIFAVLLVLMIIVGIVCTIANSKKTANAGASLDTENSALDTANSDLSQDDVENIKDKIFVTYASSNADTVELGSTIDSDYGILIDLSTNTIVAQKDPDATIFPASMTKIMTLIVAYENCKDLDEKFTMTNEILDPLYRANASVAGFSAGEEITVRDLLYGAILPSGGDATDALAIHIGGSIEGFVEMMNKKVIRMGLSNTHFANPSGLHDNDHYSTAHEMAMILQYAMKIEECREILSTYKYTTAKTIQHPDGIPLVSTMFSRMAGDESEKATVLGGKTGYTNEGLHCLASFAKVNATGKEYVFVTAHGPETYDPIFDCINVYKELFK